MTRSCVSQHSEPWQDVRGSGSADRALIAGAGPGRTQGRTDSWALRYPKGSVLLVAGIPGAGKTTLINRVFKTTAGSVRTGWSHPGENSNVHPRVLDSADIRTALRSLLSSRLPYQVYRPAVHTLHYARIGWLTACGNGELVIHECGTRGWARRAVAGLARLRRRPVHLLLIDTPPTDALAGQRSRGRIVRRHAFRRHERRWAMLRADPDALLREGWSSVHVIDRRSAGTLSAIHFDRSEDPADPGAGPTS